MKILLTGFTGNLGPEIARHLAPNQVLALVRDPSLAPAITGVELIHGALESLPETLAPSIEAIIHAAACTAFTADPAHLRRTNVEATARLLDFARTCPHLRRIIHLSTTCVCGDRTGLIPEAPLLDRPHFINAYEETKWEAEQLLLASDLPAEIIRLSIVAGSQRDGAVRRPGALHHTLFWLYKGLIPMMPGRPDSAIDLISTEFAAASVAALLRADPVPGRIIHASAGAHSPCLSELLDFLASLFARHHRGWARGSIARPDLVDAHTFALFEASARQSRDGIFQRVCRDAQCFLPGLLHSRTLATSLTDSIPVPDWRSLTARLFTWLLENDWGRPSQPSTAPAPSLT